MTYEVVYIQHARQRMVLRGISRAEVEEAIRLGTKSRREDRLVSTYRYFSVVYVLRGPKCFVITVVPRW
ncbi:MAG: DUF4258 domain-containing protein [Thermoplasmata archaeon]